uniref:Seven TM Receptor n=1 Tax=Caenorhabditis tropicalis TaxID=1561998 RepID=A0A1I7T214_9PELO
MYPLFPGGFYSVSFYLLCMPDNYGDELMKDIILNTYGLAIEDLARFIMIPYSSDNSLRWENIIFFSFGVFSIWFHYAIMLYCGFKMHFNMKQELKKFSASHRRLQKQFFYALVAQSLGPTFLLVLPVAPILIAPLLSPHLKLEFSWQTGWLYSIVGLYPPFDSISFILIVSEYKRVVKKQFCFMYTVKKDKNLQQFSVTL